MTALPDIPRLYTALAECLSVLLITPTLVPRFSKMVTAGVTLLWAAVLSVVSGADRQRAREVLDPLHGSGHRAFLLIFMGRVAHYPAGSRVSLRPGVYSGRACRQRGVAAPLCPLAYPQPMGAAFFAAAGAGVWGAVRGDELRCCTAAPSPPEHLEISGGAALTAVTLALTAFAVSNLGFLPGSDINMSIFSIRTLVDFSGVLVLTVQHEQLRENALHGELAAMDEVLHRQYEQYKRSKEGINLINRRYHELKIQLARIREEQDQAKQNAAIAAIEQNIRQYEAENKTGNPVLDTILTAKTMACQQENITITSVADGRMLGFLTIRELCTIVGVALDNAIAAVRAEPDPEKRLVKVAVYSSGWFCHAAVRALYRDCRRRWMRTVCRYGTRT